MEAPLVCQNASCYWRSVLMMSVRVASVDKETALSYLATFPNEEPPEKEAEPKPGR
jgi:hypothetical protein